MRTLTTGKMHLSGSTHLFLTSSKRYIVSFRANTEKKKNKLWQEINPAKQSAQKFWIQLGLVTMENRRHCPSRIPPLAFGSALISASLYCWSWESQPLSSISSSSQHSLEVACSEPAHQLRCQQSPMASASGHWRDWWELPQSASPGCWRIPSAWSPGLSQGCGELQRISQRSHHFVSQKLSWKMREKCTKANLSHVSAPCAKLTQWPHTKHKAAFKVPPWTKSKAAHTKSNLCKQPFAATPQSDTIKKRPQKNNGSTSSYVCTSLQRCNKCFCFLFSSP